MYHFQILVKVICRSLAVINITGNKGSSSANNFVFVEGPSERSFT